MISPIPSSSLGVSVSDITTIPEVNLTEPFILTVSPNSEPFPQMIDQDQDMIIDSELEDLDMDGGNNSSDNHGLGLRDQFDTNDTPTMVCDH